jgi:serine/threonine protein kinase
VKLCQRCGGLYGDQQQVCPRDNVGLVPVPAVGTVLDGKYRLEACLGQGGMGAVYRATHLGLDKGCAVKLIRSGRRRDEDYHQRFRLEARALGRLDHPNILRVTDFGVDAECGGVPFLVTEFLEGQTLLRELGGCGAMPLERAIPILDAIASGLDYAHREGILHRDVKPSNIFLCGDAEDPASVKILDFGLAKFAGPRERQKRPAGDRDLRSPIEAVIGEPAHALEDGGQTAEIALPDGEGLDGGATEGLTIGAGGEGMETSVDPQTREGSVVGTLGYIAPEVLGGEEAMPAADLYAFAVLVYELLTGRPPFTGSSAQLMAAPLRSSPPPPSSALKDLPQAIDSILLDALSRYPEDRPARAGDLVDDLKRVDRDERLRSWRSSELPRRSLLAVASAVLAALVLVLGGRGSFLDHLENQTVDARFGFSSPRPPTSEILLLSIDEASLDADPTPLLEKADQVGWVLRTAIEAGALGVAIDLLPSERWGESEEFARLMLEHPDRVVLAVMHGHDDRVVGSEVLGPLTMAALGPERARRLFAWVNLDLDEDGAMRRFRMAFLDQGGRWAPSFAARSAEVYLGRELAVTRPTARYWVDYTVDWRSWPKVSFKDAAAILEREPHRFSGRLVILGTEYAGTGDESFPVPHSSTLPARAPGFVLHALAVETIVQGCRLGGGRRVAVSVVCLLAALLAAGAALLLGRLRGLLVALVTASISYLALVALAFYWLGWVLPVVAPVAAVLVSAVAAFGLRAVLPAPPRRFERR